MDFSLFFQFSGFQNTMKQLCLSFINRVTTPSQRRNFHLMIAYKGSAY